MGMAEAAKEILKEGLEKFPGDEVLVELLKEIEDDSDSPDGGAGPPLLGLIILALLTRRKLTRLASTTQWAFFFIGQHESKAISRKYLRDVLGPSISIFNQNSE